MSSASIKKIIHCSKKNLVDMILDIETEIKKFDIEVEDLINNIKKGGNTNG